MYNSIVMTYKNR